MRSFDMRIIVPGGRLKEILDRLTAAQEEIFKCYNELQLLGFLTIDEKADSGN